MPKNTVNDPITDQEMAFAHLILSGTMNDRPAAEAVGLNPDTAAYTKSKPRVCDYMIEHRAAVREKLVDQEAEGLRKLNLGRDQVLARLWELANLSHEVTRGTIAGQIKALSMIVAIEGLIPDRASPRPEPNPRPRPSRHKSTALSGSANSSTKPQLNSQAMPLRPGSPTRRAPGPRPGACSQAGYRRAPSAPNFDRNQQPCRLPHPASVEPRSPRDRQRLRCRSGPRQLPQAALFHKKRPLCPPPLKSKKSQILSNFRRDKER